MSSQLLNKKLGHKNVPFVLHPLASSFRNWILSRNFKNCHFYGDWYLTKPPTNKKRIRKFSLFFNLQEGSNEMQKFYCWFPNKRTPQLDSFTDFTLVNVTPRVMEVLQALLKFLVSTPAVTTWKVKTSFLSFHHFSGCYYYCWCYGRLGGN